MLVALLFALPWTLGASFSDAQEVLTNDTVVQMVRAGLAESVIVQKIRSSQRNFDTSTAALIKLKGAGVSDRVLEAMMGGTTAPAAPAATATSAAEPAISHVSASGPQLLKPVHGSLEIKVEPFSGSRQEVVLPESRAAYRVTDRQPTFSSPQGNEGWILAKLKPGKRDRNVPMSRNSAWDFGASFREGVDPKYVIKTVAEPDPGGGFQLKPVERLQPGEYGFIAITRGRGNLNEVFEFGVD